MATIDHVSNGRFASQSRWLETPVENAMFDAPAIPHDEYYDYAEEWITIVKAAMVGPQSFRSCSANICSLKVRCRSRKPIQKPDPALMNAARSVQGQRFVAKHCDIAFVRNNDRASLEDQIGAYRRQAQELSGRNIQMWCNCFVVQRQISRGGGEISRSCR